MAAIEISDEVYEALQLPEDEREEVMREELAISLYARDVLSFGKARELTACSHERFSALLGSRGVERHYTDEELTDDLEYALE
ncbi:UPF0175 family protein [Natronobiforma cellulositropha]|uniref:UPF0175 family protein n=1 Tax=Natronobiforma cellulositropha TaxID=1679076 RepID=UPI0021D5E857|nr:UPF0175 family protein [Natronobiforma cellulositropha]